MKEKNIDKLKLYRNNINCLNKRIDLKKSSNTDSSG